MTAIGIQKPNHRKKLKAEMALLQIPDGLPDFKPVKKKGKRKTFYDYFLVFPFSFFLNMIMTFLFSTTIGNARRMVGSARTG